MKCIKPISWMKHVFLTQVLNFDKISCHTHWVIKFRFTAVTVRRRILSGKGIKSDREAELWSVFCVSITEVTIHIKIRWKSVLLFVMTWCLTYLVSKIKSAYQAKYVTNMNEMSTISRLRKHKLKMRMPHGWILLLLFECIYIIKFRRTRVYLLYIEWIACLAECTDCVWCWN